ncbi:MAG: NAD(P)/FAD-dependent oxidoreductase [Candidatus Saccharibacteria bacterium]
MQETSTPHTPSQKRILIVGGGFGGIKTALDLSKRADFAVTLLSDQDHFRYYPALYHTATGGLYAQSNIALNAIVNSKQVTLVQGKAKSLDRQNHRVITEDGAELGYEILVLAMGVVTNYFGIKGLEEHSYGIKSWEQIKKFKDHLHQQLADGTPDLNYIIVGAGPTGIELAGALPAYLEKIMRNHGAKGPKPHITIIEAALRLLPRSPEKISSAVQKRLEKLGIELRLGQTVEGQTADSLMVNGQAIDSKTVVWTAGTSNHPFFKENNFALTDRGKVQVDECLRAEEGIYVIGDNANTEFSGLAQTALRDGNFVADDIVRRADGKTPEAYKPKKPISVIPVGEGWAAVEWGNKQFAGLIGWMLRSAADWIGFHDVEPWWKASQQWMTEFGSQEDCPTCAKK